MTSWVCPSGGDDTAALQAAVDLGGKVCLGSGTFWVSAHPKGWCVRIDRDDVEIEGDQTTIKLLPGQDEFAYMLWLGRDTPVSRISVHGVTFDGNREAQTVETGHRNGIFAGMVNGLKVYDCVFQDTEGDGIQLNQMVGAVIERCSFIRNGRNGISLTGSGRDIRIVGNWFHDFFSTAVDAEPNVPGDAFDMVSVVGNTSSRDQEPGVYSVTPFGAVDRWAKGWQIDGNRFVHTLYLRFCEEVTVTNNWIEGQIRMLGCSRNTTLIGNTVRSSQGPSNSGALYALATQLEGREPERAEGLTVQGNDLVSDSEPAVRIWGGDRVSLLGNRLVSGGLASVVLRARLFDLSSTLVANNQLKGGRLEIQSDADVSVRGLGVGGNVLPVAPSYVTGIEGLVTWGDVVVA